MAGVFLRGLYIFSALELPLDYPRPAIQTFDGERYGVELSDAMVAGIRAQCQRHRVTLFMTLLTVFKVLLYRYTGQTDIVVGTPIAGRERAELEHVQGLFLNTLVLRTEVDGEIRFSELLARVRETTLGAYAHQEVPFERLVEELHPQRDLSRPPLYQVMFNKLIVQPDNPEAVRIGLQGSNEDMNVVNFDVQVGESKTAQERIVRYAGGLIRHLSQVSTPFVGIPHFSQTGLLMRGTRRWQSGHQRDPAFSHPPHTGGKSKSKPLQVHR